MNNNNIEILSGYKLRNTESIDSRNQVALKTDLLNAVLSEWDDGHFTYCLEDKTYYQLDKNGETSLETGKFKKFTSGEAIIDVTELPTQDIKTNAIYRLTNSAETETKYYYQLPGEEKTELTLPTNLYATFGSSAGSWITDENKLAIKIDDVTTEYAFEDLTDTIIDDIISHDLLDVIPSDRASFRSLIERGSGYNVVKISSDNYVYRGNANLSVEDITITPASYVLYHNPTGETTNWKIIGSGAIIDVETLPSSNIEKNVLYRITKNNNIDKGLKHNDEFIEYEPDNCFIKILDNENVQVSSNGITYNLNPVYTYNDAEVDISTIKGYITNFECDENGIYEGGSTGPVSAWNTYDDELIELQIQAGLTQEVSDLSQAEFFKFGTDTYDYHTKLVKSGDETKTWDEFSNTEFTEILDADLIKVLTSQDFSLDEDKFNACDFLSFNINTNFDYKGNGYSFQVEVINPNTYQFYHNPTGESDGWNLISNVVELTQSEYDNLSFKDPDIVYFITDGSQDGSKLINYNELQNKPTINGITLKTGLSSEDLNMYTREQVDQKLTSVMTYKGVVSTYGDLPTENLNVGDCYYVSNDSLMYAYNGIGWASLGTVTDLTLFQKISEPTLTTDAKTIPLAINELKDDIDNIEPNSVIDKTKEEYDALSEEEKNKDGVIYTVTEENAGEDEKYNDFIKIIANTLYPVGSVYISVNNVSPATIFGGTWEQFGQGKTLVGIDTNDTDFNTVEKTGGEKTHTLTIQEIPSHNHAQYITGNDQGSAIRRDYSSDGPCTAYPQGTDTGVRGGGQAHNNLQPYIVVYMWKRIS